MEVKIETPLLLLLPGRLRRSASYRYAAGRRKAAGLRHGHQVLPGAFFSPETLYPRSFTASYILKRGALRRIFFVIVTGRAVIVTPRAGIARLSAGIATFSAVIAALSAVVVCGAAVIVRGTAVIVCKTAGDVCLAMVVVCRTTVIACRCVVLAGMRVVIAGRMGARMIDYRRFQTPHVIICPGTHVIIPGPDMLPRRLPASRHSAGVSGRPRRARPLSNRQSTPRAARTVAPSKGKSAIFGALPNWLLSPLSTLFDKRLTSSAVARAKAENNLIEQQPLL